MSEDGSADTFCHLMWNDCCFLSNLFVSLIPPCNLNDMNKINFRAVSDLSCECVTLVRGTWPRQRRGEVETGKWQHFIVTDGPVCDQCHQVTVSPADPVYQQSTAHAQVSLL